MEEVDHFFRREKREQTEEAGAAIASSQVQVTTSVKSTTQVSSNPVGGEQIAPAQPPQK